MHFILSARELCSCLQYRILLVVPLLALIFNQQLYADQTNDLHRNSEMFPPLPAPLQPVEIRPKIKPLTVESQYVPPQIPANFAPRNRFILPSNLPATNLASPDDTFGSTMSSRSSYLEQMAANTNVDPILRKNYEHLAVGYRKLITDHQTNAQLWANLRIARSSKDPEKIARAEQELADYLAAKLGNINGKAYPTNMSLQAILKEYKKAQPQKFDPTVMIRGVIVIFLLLPLFFYGVRYLHKRT